MKVPFVLPILCALAVLLGGCDRTEGFTFVNKTDETLWFYIQGSFGDPLKGGAVVGPRSSFESSMFLGGRSGIGVAATREDGQWVFDQTYSMDEWAKAGGRVLVSSSTPIAPPSEVDVIPYTGAPRPLLPSGRLPADRPTPGR